MRRKLLAVAAAVSLITLGACSKKDKEIDVPAELTDFAPSLRVQRVWDAGVGGKGEELRLGLGVAAESGNVYAAGRKGDVLAFNLENGRTVWRKDTKTLLAGGTGAGDGLVVVGSSEGVVIALNEKDGAERWRTKVNGEVLSAPAVSAKAVVVRTVDGKLRALNSETGKEMWSYEQQVPRLSLRGTSLPVITGDAVICGFDNGKVVALNVGDGSLLWESTVAPPHGKTELERLVDIDSAVKVVQGNVYAVGFQGRVAMLALDSGQIWWAQDASSYRGLAVDPENVYIATADGEVLALRRGSGIEVWRQKGLAHRGLSAPVITEDSVVVADFKGYVHWLDKRTGNFSARAEAGGARVSTAPIVSGDRVFLINDEGKVSAFKSSPIALAAAKPAKAAPAAEEGAAPAVPAAPTRRGPPSTSEPIEPPAAPPAAPAESAPPAEAAPTPSGEPR
jgi:outer membrane protein assembly factor BamB